MKFNGSTSYIVFINENVKEIKNQILTNKEKIKIYDECRKRIYHNEKLKPILEDIYNMFEFDYNNFSGWTVDDYDVIKKITYINNILKPLYDTIDSNNIPLFRKLLYEVLHPKNNAINTHLIFDMLNLLLHPQEYLKQEIHYFLLITDYLLKENKYDFYLENNNYLYFHYLTQLINLTKNTTLNTKSLELEAVCYFLKNNIDPDKFAPAINYIICNRTEIYSFFTLNFKREYKDELMNIIMDIIVNNKPLCIIK